LLQVIDVLVVRQLEQRSVLLHTHGVYRSLLTPHIQ
jgi:hypothetical protein